MVLFAGGKAIQGSFLDMYQDKHTNPKTHCIFTVKDTFKRSYGWVRSRNIGPGPDPGISDQDQGQGYRRPGPDPGI